MFKNFILSLRCGLDRFTHITDSGKIFRKPVKLAYLIIGYLHYLLPLAVFVGGIVMLFGLSSLGFRFSFAENATGLEKIATFFTTTSGVVAYIVLWALVLILTYAIAYCAVKFWTDRYERYERMHSGGQNEFQLLPIAVNYIRSKGEWQGFMVAALVAGFSVIAFVAAIMMLLLVPGEIVRNLPGEGLLGIVFGVILLAILFLVIVPIVGIIIGYFILCIHRFFAEMLGLGVSVATSLKNIKTDTNIIAKK